MQTLMHSIHVHILKNSAWIWITRFSRHFLEASLSCHISYLVLLLSAATFHDLLAQCRPAGFGGCSCLWSAALLLFLCQQLSCVHVGCRGTRHWSTHVSLSTQHTRETTTVSVSVQHRCDRQTNGQGQARTVWGVTEKTRIANRIAQRCASSRVKLLITVYITVYNNYASRRLWSYCGFCVVSAFLAMAGARNIVLLFLCTTLSLFPTIVNAIIFCFQSKSLNSVRTLVYDILCCACAECCLKYLWLYLCNITHYLDIPGTTQLALPGTNFSYTCPCTGTDIRITVDFSHVGGVFITPTDQNLANKYNIRAHYGSSIVTVFVTTSLERNLSVICTPLSPSTTCTSTSLCLFAVEGKWRPNISDELRKTAHDYYNPHRSSSCSWSSHTDSEQRDCPHSHLDCSMVTSYLQLYCHSQQHQLRCGEPVYCSWEPVCVEQRRGSGRRSVWWAGVHSRGWDWCG